MAGVELLNVTKKYGTQRAVEGLTISCDDGDLVVLLGPAGAGKTTTLKIIAGIEEPSGGSVRIKGRPVTGMPPEQRNVAMAFENYALYPHLTVRDNMAFPLRAPSRSERLSDAEITSVVSSMAKVLEIDSLLRRYPRQLSGGQRQRVSLGRALVRRPDAMLLDEPIAHLDAQLRATLRGQLKRLLKSSNVTTVYATPDYAQALGLADRVAVLEAGVLIQNDTPLNVYENPASVSVAEMLGDPKINVFEATIEGDGAAARAVAPWGSFLLGFPWASKFKEHRGRRVLLGVRPSDIAAGVTDQADGVIPGIVRLVEPVGAVTVLAVTCRGVELKCKAPSGGRWSAGDPVSLRVAAGRLLAFDVQTKASLRHTASAR